MCQTLHCAHACFHITTIPTCQFLHVTQMMKVAQRFFTLCTRSTFLVAGTQSYTGVCKQNGVRGVSGRAGSCLGSWDELTRRQEPSGTAKREQKNPCAQQVWHKVPQGEMTGHGNSVYLGYPPPSTLSPSLKTPLDRAHFFSPLQRKLCQYLAEESSFPYHRHPFVKPPKIQETSALPRYLYFFRFHTDTKVVLLFTKCHSFEEFFFSAGSFTVLSSFTFGYPQSRTDESQRGNAGP